MADVANTADLEPFEELAGVVVSHGAPSRRGTVLQPQPARSPAEERALVLRTYLGAIAWDATAHAVDKQRESLRGVAARSLALIAMRRPGGGGTKEASALVSRLNAVPPFENETSVADWSKVALEERTRAAERIRILGSVAVAPAQLVTAGGFGADLRRRNYPTLLTTGWFVRHRLPLVAQPTLDAMAEHHRVASEDPVWYRDVALAKFTTACHRKVLGMLGHDSKTDAFAFADDGGGDDDDAPDREASPRGLAAIAGSSSPGSGKRKPDVASCCLFPGTQSALSATFEAVVRPLLLPGDAVMVLRAAPDGVPSTEYDSPLVRAAIACAANAGTPLLALDVPPMVPDDDDAAAQQADALLRAVAQRLSALTPFARGIRAIVCEHVNALGGRVDPGVVEELRERLARAQGGATAKPVVIVDASMATANARPWPRNRGRWSVLFSALDRFAGCPAGACVVLTSKSLGVTSSAAELRRRSQLAMAARPALTAAVSVAIDASDHANVRRHCDGLARDALRCIGDVWGALPHVVAHSGALVTVRLPLPLRVSAGEAHRKLAGLDALVELRRTSRSPQHPPGDDAGPQPPVSRSYLLTLSVAPFHTTADFRRVATLVKDFFAASDDASTAVDPSKSSAVQSAPSEPEAVAPRNLAASRSVAEDELASGLAAKYSFPPEPVPRTPELRLRAMFARFAPERLAEVRSLLQRHRGAEEPLFDQLVLRYGLEPAPATLLSRIERFFARHDPVQLVARKAPLLAERYAGAACELIALLVARFGPEEPPMEPDPFGKALTRPRETPPGPVEQLLRALFLDGPRSRDIPFLAHRFAGRLEDLESAARAAGLSLPAKHDANDEAEDSRCLRAQYARVTPALAAHCSGVRPRYLDWLWADADQSAQFRGKWAPASAASPPPPASTRGTDAEDADEAPEERAWRHRVQRMYERYAPAKAAGARELLREWRGQEDLLMSALVARYGPEPHPDRPVAPHPLVARTQDSENSRSRRHDPAAHGPVGAVRAFYAAVRGTDAVEELLWEQRDAGRRAAILGAPNDFDVL